jgi:hypothetical protein
LAVIAEVGSSMMIKSALQGNRFGGLGEFAPFQNRKVTRARHSVIMRGTVVERGLIS